MAGRKEVDMGYSTDICPRCNGTGEIKRATVTTVDPNATTTLSFLKKEPCQFHSFVAEKGYVFCQYCLTPAEKDSFEHWAFNGGKSTLVEMAQSPDPLYCDTKPTNSELESKDKSSPVE